MQIHKENLVPFFVSVIIIAVDQNSVSLCFECKFVNHVNFTRTALYSLGNFYEQGVTTYTIISEYVINKSITELNCWNIDRCYLFAEIVFSVPLANNPKQIVPRQRMRLPDDTHPQLSTFPLIVGGYSLHIRVIGCYDSAKRLL